MNGVRLRSRVVTARGRSVSRESRAPLPNASRPSGGGGSLRHEVRAAEAPPSSLVLLQHNRRVVYHPWRFAPESTGSAQRACLRGGTLGILTEHLRRQAITHKEDVA